MPRPGADCPGRPAAIYAGAAVLLLAVMLRFWALDRLPGGLHFDLGANLLDVVDVLGGERPARRALAGPDRGRRLPGRGSAQLHRRAPGRPGARPAARGRLPGRPA